MNSLRNFLCFLTSNASLARNEVNSKVKKMEKERKEIFHFLLFASVQIEAFISLR